MLLTAKYVIPVTSAFIEDGAVLVQDDRIADIGTFQELQAKYPDEPVKDYGAAAIAPGFINLHTQLRYSALRGMLGDFDYADWRIALYVARSVFEKDDWINSARLGALEAVASGITTVADIMTMDDTLKAIDESGLRGVVYREVKTPHSDEVEGKLQEAVADIEQWSAQVDNDRITFGLAGGSTFSTHPKVYKAIAEYVGTSDMPVTMHLAGSQAESDFLRYGSSSFSSHGNTLDGSIIAVANPEWLPSGVSPVRYVYNWDIFGVPNMLIIHAVKVDDDDIEILKRTNVSVAYCPRINAQLSMGAAPVGKFLEAGITVGLGTDSPAAVDTIDMIDEMRFGLMVARATGNSHGRLVSDQALRMATIDAAKALHMDDEIGSLEVGKKADIIAIDLHNSHQNPISDPVQAIIYTANQDNVMMTMVNGKVLYDGFVHIGGLKRDEIVEDAKELRNRIRGIRTDEEIRKRVIERVQAELTTRVKR